MKHCHASTLRLRILQALNSAESVLFYWRPEEFDFIFDLGLEPSCILLIDLLLLNRIVTQPVHVFRIIRPDNCVRLVNCRVFYSLLKLTLLCVEKLFSVVTPLLVITTCLLEQTMAGIIILDTQINFVKRIRIRSISQNLLEVIIDIVPVLLRVRLVLLTTLTHVT